MNVASGLKQFARGLSSAPEVQELVASARSRDDSLVIAERFNQVAARPANPDYENPWDVALAAYLLVLDRVDPPQAAVCAERALTSPHGWWSKKLADTIISENSHGSPVARH
jgi:hypothetical protein